MATGFESWKIAKGLYVVPLMFAYTPLISGSVGEIIHIGLFGLFGIYALNALIQNYAEGPITWRDRAIFALGAGLCFWPLMWMANLAGAALVVLAVWASRRNH